MELGLKGKNAVITGGSVGIGLAIAEGLAAEGANVILAARGQERVEAEAARIASKYGVSATGIAADVATAEGTNSVIRAAAEAGERISSSTMLAPAQTRRSWRPMTKSGNSTSTCMSWLRSGLPGSCAPNAGKGRRRYFAQRVHMRRATALVRAHLQCHQGRLDDVLENSFHRADPAEHKGELREPRPRPDAGLDQDRQAADCR